MFDQTTSKGTHNATSSPASADGALAPDLQAGQIPALFGPDPAPASPSVSPALRMAERKVKAIQGIFGRPSTASLASADLQLSLENRLKTRLPGDGSTRFVGTWKVNSTPAHRRYCQLAPSGRIMKDNGYIGLPTPVARDHKDISRGQIFISQRLRHSPSLAIRLLDQGAPWVVITRVYCMTMGYPLQWNDARPKATVTPSSLKSRLNLSAPISTPNAFD